MANETPWSNLETCNTPLPLCMLNHCFSTAGQKASPHPAFEKSHGLWLSWYSCSDWNIEPSKIKCYRATWQALYMYIYISYRTNVVMYRTLSDVRSLFSILVYVTIKNPAIQGLIYSYNWFKECFLWKATREFVKSRGYESVNFSTSWWF